MRVLCVKVFQRKYTFAYVVLFYHSTGKTDAAIVLDITTDMLRRLPPAVEHDSALSDAEREEQLTLGRLLTSQVWSNLLSKSRSKRAHYGFSFVFFWSCFEALY